MKEILARIRAAWANLADRERLLVGLAGGALLLTFLYLGLVLPILSQGKNLAERRLSAEQQLQVMRRLRVEYDEVSTRLDAVEERIRTGTRGNLRTALENMAQQAGVKIESMENQGAPADDRYTETRVELGLKGVTLPQLVSYLHRIETSRQVLTVKSLRIRTKGSRSGEPQDLLDATFTVSSFEPI